MVVIPGVGSKECVGDKPRERTGPTRVSATPLSPAADCPHASSQCLCPVLPPRALHRPLLFHPGLSRPCCLLARCTDGCGHVRPRAAWFRRWRRAPRAIARPTRDSGDGSVGWRVAMRTPPLPCHPWATSGCRTVPSHVGLGPRTVPCSMTQGSRARCRARRCAGAALVEGAGGRGDGRGLWGSSVLGSPSMRQPPTPGSRRH